MPVARTVAMLLTAAVVAGCAATTTQWAVERKYNRFTDETRYVLHPITLVATTSDGEATPSLTLAASFNSPGLVNVQRPRRITLALESQDERQHFKDQRELRLWLDGEELSLGQLGHDGTVVRGQQVEYLWIELPVETFERIAQAKSLSGMLGQHRFGVDGETLDKLQEFARRIPQE